MLKHSSGFLSCSFWKAHPESHSLNGGNFLLNLQPIFLNLQLFFSPYYFILMYTPYSHCPSVPVPLLCTFHILQPVSEAGLPSHKTGFSASWLFCWSCAALFCSKACFLFQFFLQRQLPRATRSISQEVSPQHLAQQYSYNAPLFPGKGCTDTASNLHFLWLTTAPWFSPSLNPPAPVHCQNICYFPLNTMRSYLLQHYISHLLLLWLFRSLCGDPNSTLYVKCL